MCFAYQVSKSQNCQNIQRHFTREIILTIPGEIGKLLRFSLLVLSLLSSQVYNYQLSSISTSCF
jgi:hypothetical protein